MFESWPEALDSRPPSQMRVPRMRPISRAAGFGGHVDTNRTRGGVRTVSPPGLISPGVQTWNMVFTVVFDDDRCNLNLVRRGRTYVGARFGTFFACPPGMTQSLGADCSAPGISPCPLR
eukprot:5760963-Prymnesium_polylepis.1